MEPIGSIDELKTKLKTYKKEDVIFNEPHFTTQLTMREGNKDDVIKNLLNPENLVSYYSEPGKYNDIKYSLYFKVSSARTMKIPVIFDLNNKKSIYVLTYIMRYRPWQSMVKDSK
jgi:hypothetical protein